MMNSPPEDLEIRLECVLSNSIEHDVNSTVESFPTGDLEDFFNDVDGAIIEEAMLCACFDCESCFLFRRSRSDDVRSEVLATMEDLSDM